MRFLSLSVSARNNVAARRNASSLSAHHRDTCMQRPADDSRVAHSSLRGLSVSACARLLLAPVLFAAASLPLRAQDLVAVSGEHGTAATMQRLDTTATVGSPVLSSAVLAAIPAGQRIRGITRVDSQAIALSEFIVYTEQGDGTSHLWKVDYIAISATVRITPLLWDDDSTITRPEDMVGIARTPLGLPGFGLLGLPAWHTSLGESGTLYGPLLDGLDPDLPLSASCPVTGTLPFPGPFVGSHAHNDHLWAVTGGAIFQLKKVSVPCGQSLIAPTVPVEVQSWTVPVDGQVLGWTLSDAGVFYAIVNRVVEDDGLYRGYTELVRSVESVNTATAVLTLTSIGGHIQDWENGNEGPILLPPVYLTFAENLSLQSGS